MLCSEGVAGPGLLLQLGRLIVRARSDSPAPDARALPHLPLHPAHQPHTQQPTSEEDARLEATLRAHIDALWTQQAPFCVEVVLAPPCAECSAALARGDAAARGVLLERWTMQALSDKSESPNVISSPWLLNAVRSQLHFSQLSAWRARRAPRHPRRRKLSREQCIKKLEASSSEEPARALSVVYSVSSPPQRARQFLRPPTDHTFPLTDTGNNSYLKVVVESLPRVEEIPEVRCGCARRGRGDPVGDELGARLNDLSIGSRKYEGAINSNTGSGGRRNSIISNPNPTSEYLLTLTDSVVDDRMHTPCRESGKHRCNCDDDSDSNKNQAKKLDERRIKEIAKYKRRIRKEKMRKFCDSTSSEGEKKETTSIPILQASRFDRFRAIGCYRNQTYLTLPASRIETKSPFLDNEYTPPDFKKTNTIATQTEFACLCGSPLEVAQRCEGCRGLVRSEGAYDLATLAGRKPPDDGDKSLKKHKCDNNISNFNDGIIKRPKLRRLYPIVDRLERIVTDRNKSAENDMQQLHLKTDDSVFSTPKEGNSPKNEMNARYNDSAVNSNDESDLNPSDELGKFHPEYKGTQPNTDESGNLHDNSDELDPNKNETGKLHSKYKDPKSNHAESNGYSSDKDRNETNPAEVSRNPHNDETPRVTKRQKTFSINDDEFITYEKCDYGTIEKHDSEIESPVEERPDFKFSNPEQNEIEGEEHFESLKEEFRFPCPGAWAPPRPARAASRPARAAPPPRAHHDDSVHGVNGVKSGLFQPISPASPRPAPRPPSPRRQTPRTRHRPNTGLLGSFEESALQGRLEAVATVHGFTAELAASGAFCPPHRRLPVTVFFYAPGGTAAPYMGHISLGPGGYGVPRAGSVQVSLFNPHGTLVKMFCVPYDLSAMPRAATTFLRQRTLRACAGAAHAPLRYLIHLRFMTTKTGKLYLHTDIRLIVSRKADLDTATALRAPLSPRAPPPRHAKDKQPPNRVFGGSSEHDSEVPEIGYDNTSYELRSYTYAPDNPKYSPR